MKRRPILMFAALDVPPPEEALRYIATIDEIVDDYKIGLELYTGGGWVLIDHLKNKGRRVFIDLKLNDIPETVFRAARNLAKQGADFLTVHVNGGRPMLEAAVAGAKEGNAETRVLGVTVLTSLDRAKLAEVGVNVDPTFGLKDLVFQRSMLAQDAGCHGVIASPQETASLRLNVRRDFLIINPGIRQPGADQGDQVRVGTARQAVLDGADGIVIGRPIRDAKDPLQAAREFRQELDNAYAEIAG